MYMYRVCLLLLQCLLLNLLIYKFAFSSSLFLFHVLGRGGGDTAHKKISTMVGTTGQGFKCLRGNVTIFSVILKSPLKYSVGESGRYLAHCEVVR